MEDNNKQQNNKQNDNNKKSPNRSFIFMLILSVGLTLLFFYAYTRIQESRKEEISYGQFLDMLNNGEAEMVRIYGSTIEVEPRDKDGSKRDKIYYVTRISDLYLVDRLEAAKEKGEVDYIAVNESGSALLSNILSWVIMIAG
ncbi:MAG: ATP-dependent metallopeptidase FtsH/Yme1/Tma family protein, partial [Lachnospiraceae bacterium]|nr:ATP-dependent metallopeptidase FtsH/Yme1/Tma family protein [Lachnospiraceae bacterium]